MQLTIEKAGPQVLISDLGRYHYQHLGVSPAECQDLHAYGWANRLVGNPLGAPMLEMSFGMTQLSFQSSAVVAITGADCPLLLNQQPVISWQTLYLSPGDQLSIGAARQGLRSYLAIAGHLSLPAQLGSYASSPREALGPYAGAPLRSGAVLTGTAAPRLPYRLATPKRFIPDYNQPLTLSLIPGYQFAQLSENARLTLLEHSYQIAPQSDRMGYRLSGEAIVAPDAPVNSQGVTLGCVQLPPDGQPIILMGNRQTIGGYSKLGCISRLSASQLSQRRPGQRVRFVLTSAEQAHLALTRHLQFFNFAP